MATISATIAYGPRYWSRAWYFVKAKAFQAVRGKPIDYAVDKIRRDYGVIITNQKALGHLDVAEVAAIKPFNQEKNWFSPGRELRLTVAAGTSALGLTKALEYLIANQSGLFPDQLPKPVQISTEPFWHQSKTDRVVLSEPLLLDEQLFKVNYLADLARFKLPVERFAALDAALEQAGCVLNHQRPLRPIFREPNLKETGYEAAVGEPEAPLDDLAAYNAKKYTPIMGLIIADAIEHQIPIEVHWGYPKQVESLLFRQGYKPFNFLMKREQFFELYIAVQNGRYKYVISLADRGRVLHCQKMLKLSGIPEGQVTRVQHFSSIYDQVKELVDTTLGPIPPQVIFGNRGTFRRLVKINRLLVESLRDLAVTLPNAQGALTRQHPEIAAQLMKLREKYAALLNLRKSLNLLASDRRAVLDYLVLEREIEEIREQCPAGELGQVRTIISIFRDWKDRLGLHQEDDGFKICSLFSARAEATTDRELAIYYRDLAERFNSLWEFEKPELKTLFALPPEQLFDHPAHLMNLVRLEEVIVALYHEHKVVRELENLRVFPIDIEVGYKFITPLFKCQRVNYLDAAGGRHKLLLMDVPYGETAAALAECLREKGVKTILFTGIVGGVQGVELGEIVIPSEFVTSGDKVIGMVNNTFRRDNSTKAIWQTVVDTPYDETAAWLKAMRQSGVNVADVEAARVAQALAGSDVIFGSVNIVSDLIGERGKGLAASVEKNQVISAREKIMRLFMVWLGIDRVSSEIHRQPRAVIDLFEGRVENYVGKFQVTFTHPEKDRRRRLEMIARALNLATCPREVSDMIIKLELQYNCQIKIIPPLRIS